MFRLAGIIPMLLIRIPALSAGSLHGVNTNLAVNVTATTYIQYEQNLSLVDSGGNATGVTLNAVYARLP